MSKTSVNNGQSSGKVSTDITFAGTDSKDKMYEPKHKKRLVRVLTVFAYVISVSLAAIMLSLFYIFIYNPDSPKHGKHTTNLYTGGFNVQTNYSEIRRFPGSHPHTNFSIRDPPEDYDPYAREEPLALPNRKSTSTEPQLKQEKLHDFKGAEENSTEEAKKNETTVVKNFNVNSDALQDI